MIHWTPGTTIESAEREVIEQALKFYRGNKTATASALKVSTRTLDNKLEQYADDDRKSREHADRSAQGSGPSLHEQARPQEDKANGSKEVGISSDAGLRVESSFEVRTEPNVSVPERQEVQEVLPPQTRKRSASRSR